MDSPTLSSLLSCYASPHPQFQCFEMGKSPLPSSPLGEFVREIPYLLTFSCSAWSAYLSWLTNKFSNKSWIPLKISKNISLSHLFCTDDVFLLGKASIPNIECMMEVMKKFGDCSGLYMNLDKSRIIFSHKMHGVLRHSISSFTGIKSSIILGTYLGVNISPNKLSKKDYFSLLDKTKERI